MLCLTFSLMPIPGCLCRRWEHKLLCGTRKFPNRDFLPRITTEADWYWSFLLEFSKVCIFFRSQFIVFRDQKANKKNPLAVKYPNPQDSVCTWKSVLWNLLFLATFWVYQTCSLLLLERIFGGTGEITWSLIYIFVWTSMSKNVCATISMFAYRRNLS